MVTAKSARDVRSNQIGRLMRMLRTMLIIREFEEAARQCAVDGLVRGSVHESTGQEAVPVGVCSNLRTDDLIHSNHRGHGHAISKGANPVAMMKELFGRVGGTCGGKGGSMHIADFSVGMLGANGILADGVTMAAGAAQGLKLLGRTQIVGVFVGDGTTNRGPFFEGLNWAKVYDLPLLIVCENNRYASSTVTEKVTAGEGPAKRAAAFGIPAVTVDGNDVMAVDQAAGELVERVRNGGGPQFLHAVTYRVRGHVFRDHLHYRPNGETEFYWKNEPIGRLERWLSSHGVAAEEMAGLRKEADRIIATAVEEAKSAPFPDPADAYRDVQELGAPKCVS
jgi:acetoin:2,6-dichlorophenolindophenol oxidoreductase subunit alpha